MKKQFYILTLFTLFLSGCEKDKNDDSANSNLNNLPVAIQLDSFPLTVGHTWKYYTEIHVADSAGVVYQSDYFDNYWTVILDTIIVGIQSYKISQLDSNYNGTTHIAYSYYASTPDGFFGMAFENTGAMFYLKTTSKAEADLNSFLQFSKLSNVDTLFIPDSSLWFLKFPSALNDVWHAVKYGTGSLYQTRKYESYQTVNTSAGTFDCLKTKIYYENNGQPDSTSQIIYQYFSEKGLIKETQLVHLNFSCGSTGTMSRTTTLVQVNF